MKSLKLPTINYTETLIYRPTVFQLKYWIQRQQSINHFLRMPSQSLCKARMIITHNFGDISWATRSMCLMPTLSHVVACLGEHLIEVLYPTASGKEPCTLRCLVPCSLAHKQASCTLFKSKIYRIQLGHSNKVILDAHIEPKERSNAKKYWTSFSILNDSSFIY